MKSFKLAVSLLLTLGAMAQAEVSPRAATLGIPFTGAGQLDSTDSLQIQSLTYTPNPSSVLGKPASCMTTSGSTKYTYDSYAFHNASPGTKNYVASYAGGSTTAIVAYVDQYFPNDSICYNFLGRAASMGADRSFSFSVPGGHDFFVIVSRTDTNPTPIPYLLKLSEFTLTNVVASTGFTIPAVGESTPDPGTVNLSGITTDVRAMDVKLNNLTHSFPQDLDILLLSPHNKGIFLMSDVGGSSAVTNVNLNFSTSTGTNLSASALPSGTFNPTNSGLGDVLPDVTPSATVLSFPELYPDGLNGTWSLYVYDDSLPDAGTLGGWAMDVESFLAIPTLTLVTTPITVQAGSNPSALTPIANYSDPDAAPSTESVTVIAPDPKLNLSETTISGGVIQTRLSATCDATPGTHSVTAALANSQTAGSFSFDVQVSANTAPSLGTYTSAHVRVGDTTAFVPSAAPSDNGSLTLSVNSPDLSGLAVDAITGAVTLTDAQPLGVHSLTVTATDNCGLATTRTFTVTVDSVPHTIAIADTDGDGFSDGIETALQTSPTDANSTPLGGSSAPLAVALGTSKLSIGLNFAKAQSDMLVLSGTVQLPADFTVNGQVFAMDMGGVSAAFTLDAKGHAKTANSQFTLSAKLKNGKTVAAQTAKFSAKLVKGNFAAQLADDGLVGSSDLKKVSRTLPIQIYFAGTIYEQAKEVLYSAKTGKAGAAK